MLWVTFDGAAGMGNRFIPDGDREFRTMARSFAENIAKDPAKYTLDKHDAEMLCRAVEEFHAATTKAAPATRNFVAVRAKREARKKCEQIVRRLGRIIRASDQISDADKLGVHIFPRDPRPTKRTVPQTAPMLYFRGVENDYGLGGTPVHVIAVQERPDIKGRKKPHGAVRVELFISYVPDGQPIPRHPRDSMGGWPLYLRSYSTSPIKVSPPLPPVSMMVVYWARWADAKGNVGPFSATLVTRAEGWGGIGASKEIGRVPDAKQLEDDAKYLTIIRQLRQMERTTEPPLLADERGENEKPRVLEDGRGDHEHGEDAVAA
jgi:hypothetical protein